MTWRGKWVSQKIGFISFGFFLILVGFIWLNTPDLKDAVVAFFKDFHLEKAFQDVRLPAPRSEWVIKLYTTHFNSSAWVTAYFK